MRKTPTMADEVHRILRHEITHNILKAGSPLVEEEIAERLGVSRSPVRDSMQRLAAERLIVSRRRRWIVKDHTTEEIVEIYQVRAALESYGARLAAEAASSEERQEILALSTVDDPDPRARAEINERFHDLIIRSSHNERLASVRDLNTIVHFDANIASLYTRDDLDASAQQHVGIGRAIAAGNAEEAARLSREHVEYSMQLLIAKSRRLPALSGAGAVERSAR